MNLSTDPVWSLALAFSTTTISLLNTFILDPCLSSLHESCRVMEVMDLGVLVGRAWCQGNHDVVCTNIAENQDGAGDDTDEGWYFYHPAIFILNSSPSKRRTSLLPMECWPMSINWQSRHPNHFLRIYDTWPIWHVTYVMYTWDMEAKVCKWSCMFSEWIILS